MTNRRERVWRAVLLLCSLTAIVLIVASTMQDGRLHSTAVSRPGAGNAIDPSQVVPAVTQMPRGSSITSHAYIDTKQASQTNQIPVRRLLQMGREIGFDRDFFVPGYGDVDVLVVRYRTHLGLSAAYRYFLSLAGRQGLKAVPAQGIGDSGAVVISMHATFIEFFRGRYYVVVTAMPSGNRALQLIASLAHVIDLHVQHLTSNV